MRRTIRRSVAQQIVETVKDVCAHDINFIDASGVIFASTDASRVGSYHEIGRQVVQRGETLEVEQDDAFYGTHRGVNLPVRFHDEIIAAVGISGAPDEVRKYAYLAQRIAALILREQEQDEQNSSERARMNYFIRALISGEALDYDVYMDLLRRFGIEGGARFTTVVVRVEARGEDSNLSMIEDAVYRTFEEAGSKLYTFGYPNEYILLIETGQCKKRSRLFRQLALEQRGNIKIGIGSDDALTRQEASYQAAKIALSSLIGGENLAAFDQLDLEILLGAIPDAARQRYLEKTVSALDERDREILRAYFGGGMSLKAASEALFMHKNTLQYQLERIHRRCGYDPRSFRDAVALYLGLRLLP